MPPKSPLWKYFHTNKLWYKAGGTHNNAWCEACIAAYVNERIQADTVALTEPSPTPPRRLAADLENEGRYRMRILGHNIDIVTALTEISPMVGKLDKMESHLKTCQKISNKMCARALAEFKADKENRPSTSRNSVSSVPICTKITLHSPHLIYNAGLPSLSTDPRPLKRARTSLSSIDDAATEVWSTGHQQEFNKDMLKLFASCGFAWNSASNPQMGLFVEKYIPGARVPDCRALSGHILDSEVAKVEARTKERIMGKMATGQCDGWKNVAKTSVVTSMITVTVQIAHLELTIIASLTLLKLTTCQGNQKRATSCLKLSSPISSIFSTNSGLL
jgi:hypothetical protein